MNDQEDLLIGRIEAAGDVAHRLGVAMASFTALEFLLVQICAAALGECSAGPMKKSWAICNTIRSAGARCNLIRDLVRASDLPDEVSNKLASLLDAISALNAKRNAYAHGIWEGNSAGLARLTETNAQNGRVGLPRPVTAAELEDFILNIRRTTGAVANVLKVEVQALIDTPAA